MVGRARRGRKKRSDAVESGARTLVKVLLSALLVGILVVIFHPAYRGAMASLWRRTPEDSPVWQANEAYYPEVNFDEQGGNDANAR